MPETDQYDADYFLHGRTSGKSLYEDYRWLPELTIPMAMHLAEHIGLGPRETVLDFGCARGYLVRALRGLGHLAFGVDASKWAIENCDESVREFVRLAPWFPPVDWSIAKDVLEHVRDSTGAIDDLMKHSRRGVFAIVPLSYFDNQPYVIGDYEKDTTHLHRLTLATWVHYFIRPGWSVEASYSVRGIKDNYLDAHLHAKHVPDWHVGNGFITARRIGR